MSFHKLIAIIILCVIWAASHSTRKFRDISAVYWGGPEGPVSCYVATDDGLYLIDIDTENLPDCVMHHLGTDENYGYPPLQYDLNIVSMDYYFRGGCSQR